MRDLIDNANAFVFAKLAGVKQAFRDLRDDKCGATAIEYALIASLVSVAAITAFNTVGGNIVATVNEVAGELVAAPN